MMNSTKRLIEFLCENEEESDIHANDKLKAEIDHLMVTFPEIFKRDLDVFTRAYLAAMDFTESERLQEEAESAGFESYDLDNLSDSAVDRIRNDCLQFQAENAALLESAGSVEQNGHDFWFSRNGHGTGFFDRQYPGNVGDLLQAQAHAYGEVYAYIGDDGAVYLG